MKLFHICTIANNLAMYEAMKSSFIEAGFDEDRCKYTLLDNSNGNIYEPFSAFNAILSNTVEPYIVFCHQDVLLNQGHGFKQLVSLIEELDKLDPNWAVLGNAGFTNNYKLVAQIKDPNSTSNWVGNFPQKVHSLDENFLVVKSCAKIFCSSELKGFHFYGTDLCLNAIQNGYSCYVINFYLTHLSGGSLKEDFYQLRNMFQDKWSNQFKFCYIKTLSSSAILLSKNRVLRTILSNKIINKVIGWWILCNSPLKLLVNVELR